MWYWPTCMCFFVHACVCFVLYVFTAVGLNCTKHSSDFFFFLDMIRFCIMMRHPGDHKVILNLCWRVELFFKCQTIGIFMVINVPTYVLHNRMKMHNVYAVIKRQQSECNVILCLNALFLWVQLTLCYCWMIFSSLTFWVLTSWTDFWRCATSCDWFPDNGGSLVHPSGSFAP